MTWHRLLERQIKHKLDGLDSPEQVDKLLALVSEAYEQADTDRALLERSLELTSNELVNRNRELHAQLEEQKAVKTALEQSYSLLHASLNATHDGLLVVDREGNVRLYNPMFLQMLGIQSNEPALNKIDDLLNLAGIASVDGRAFVAELKKSVDRPDARHEFEIAFKDNCYIEAFSNPQLVGQEIVGQVWSFRDVSELRLKEEEAKHRAYHDLLTGLPNRRLLTIRLSQALKHSQVNRLKTAVLFIDLDGFKDVNDYLGHAIGDALLKEVSRRLESQLPVCGILARHGGDEFVAIMENQVDSAGAEDFATKVLEAFAEPFQLAEDEVYMSCSIGIALSPDHGEEPDRLISCADMAMYQAKEQGKNALVIYSSDQGQQSVHRLKIRSQINTALELNQFELFFQPKVELATGRIVGAEALIRWRAADGSYRSPIEFIPTAEENGQIIPISQWLIRQCCQHLIDWASLMPDDFVLALNISAKHFKRGVLQSDLNEALAETGANPQKLEFEVTETAVMDNVELAVTTLEQLNEIGIRTAIDDFGTGHSSLSYLRRLPIEILKIDKSFIDEILISEEDKTLVNGIISMVHALGIEVVAEGVENEQMAWLLRQMNCDLVQGYHYCPPVCEAEFIQLLKEGKCYPV